MIPVDTIDKLEEIFSSLSALGASLTEAQWKTPTQLPGWTVQDNLSHMVGTERTMEGLPATPHRSVERDWIKNPIGAANENEVDARRTMPGAEVLAEWNEIAARRIATLRGADDAYYAVEAMTPTGPGTRADFLHIRVLDCWMHEQDMRRTLGLPGHQSGPAAEHTVDRLIRTIPIVVGKRAQTPEGGTVVIEITGPVERRVVATVVEGRAQLGTEGNVLATVRMDSDTFIQLAGGRATHTEAAGWSAEGDTALAERVVANFNMRI
ncbi:MAG: maleylpyruvate isomerase family mycothiol-dependent enzyme [Actinomycetota bacterium]